MAVASNSIIRHKVTKDKRFVTIPVQIPTYFTEVKTMTILLILSHLKLVSQ